MPVRRAYGHHTHTAPASVATFTANVAAIPGAQQRPHQIAAPEHQSRHPEHKPQSQHARHPPGWRAGRKRHESRHESRKLLHRVGQRALVHPQEAVVDAGQRIDRPAPCPRQHLERDHQVEHKNPGQQRGTRQAEAFGCCSRGIDRDDPGQHPPQEICSGNPERWPQNESHAQVP
jgi:hypothetical protein